MKKAKDRVSLFALVRGAKLRPGSRFRLAVTRRDMIGRVTTWKIRRRKAPVRTDRCLPPGVEKPQRCEG